MKTISNVLCVVATIVVVIVSAAQLFLVVAVTTVAVVEVVFALPMFMSPAQSRQHLCVQRGLTILMPYCAYLRYTPAQDQQQAYRGVPQGALFQSVDVLRRPSADAQGDRAADGAHPGRRLPTPAWRGGAGCPHSRRQVGLPLRYLVTQVGLPLRYLVTQVGLPLRYLLTGRSNS